MSALELELDAVTVALATKLLGALFVISTEYVEVPATDVSAAVTL